MEIGKKKKRSSQLEKLLEQSKRWESLPSITIREKKEEAVEKKKPFTTKTEIQKKRAEKEKIEKEKIEKEKIEKEKAEKEKAEKEKVEKKKAEKEKLKTEKEKLKKEKEKVEKEKKEKLQKEKEKKEKAQKEKRTTKKIIAKKPPLKKKVTSPLRPLSPIGRKELPEIQFSKKEVEEIKEPEEIEVIEPKIKEGKKEKIAEGKKEKIKEGKQEITKTKEITEKKREEGKQKIEKQKKEIEEKKERKRRVSLPRELLYAQKDTAKEKETEKTEGIIPIPRTPTRLQTIPLKIIPTEIPTKEEATIGKHTERKKTISLSEVMEKSTKEVFEEVDFTKFIIGKKKKHESSYGLAELKAIAANIGIPSSKGKEELMRAIVIKAREVGVDIKKAIEKNSQKIKTESDRRILVERTLATMAEFGIHL